MFLMSDMVPEAEMELFPLYNLKVAVSNNNKAFICISFTFPEITM